MVRTVQDYTGSSVVRSVRKLVFSADRLTPTERVDGVRGMEVGCRDLPRVTPQKKSVIVVWCCCGCFLRKEACIGVFMERGLHWCFLRKGVHVV